MELSINVLGFYGAAPGEPPVTPSEGIARALADGFRVFDFPLADLGFFDGDWRRELDASLEVCARGGGEIRYTHVPFRFPWGSETPESWAAFDAKMACAIEAAHILGVRFAAMHPYTTNVPAQDYDAAPCRDAAIRHLLPWLELCAKWDVRLCAENMQGDAKCFPHRRYCAKVDELCELVDALSLPGIVWDTGHAHIAGHVQSEALRQAGSRLKMLHIHDNEGSLDLHLAPYMGSVDWADLLDGLRAVRYDGDINYEQDLRRIPSDLRAPVIRYLKDVGDRFIAVLQEGCI